MFSVKPMYRVYFLAAVLILILLAGCLPIRPEFSHQGRLLTNTGDPVPDGVYSVVYKFYNVASGGSPVHTTAAQNVTVEEGLFNIAVGASPEDINPEIFSKPTWVEVVIGGETLAPRIKLLGSPYAFSLAPGAVVGGPETITRTFSGQENTGATFTAWNSDTSATGGNGAFVINQAAAPVVERDKVAALQVVAAGGVPADSTGSYGAKIISKGYRGMLVDTDAPGYFTAVFEGNLGIFVTGGGSCTGCATSYIAKNTAAEEFAAGTFVTVEGVEVDPDLNVPVMLVRPATSASDPVIGVSTGALSYTPVQDYQTSKIGGFDGVEGPAKSGGYLTVVVSGLVQVQVGASSALSTGDWVALDNGQVALAGAGQQGVARLLSSVDAGGYAWVMFDGQ
jgi:hypothetical protein